MTETEALLKIAEAISDLASSVYVLVIVAWLFLLLKNMGGKDNSDAIRKLADEVKRLVDKN